MRHFHFLRLSTLLVLAIMGLSGCGNAESTGDTVSSGDTTSSPSDQARIAQCQSSSDCDDSAMVCNKGVCLFVGRTPDCMSNEDCEAEKVCDFGECVPE